MFCEICGLPYRAPTHYEPDKGDEPSRLARVIYFPFRGSRSPSPIHNGDQEGQMSHHDDLGEPVFVIDDRGMFGRDRNIAPDPEDVL